MLQWGQKDDGNDDLWKIPPASRRRRQEDNILVNLKKKTGSVLLISWQNPLMISCEDGTEPSDFIKTEAFFDKICYCRLLVKDFALWNLL
jgi:hypothetical protein